MKKIIYDDLVEFIRNSVDVFNHFITFNASNIIHIKDPEIPEFYIQIELDNMIFKKMYIISADPIIESHEFESLRKTIILFRQIELALKIKGISEESFTKIIFQSDEDLPPKKDLSHFLGKYIADYPAIYTSQSNGNSTDYFIKFDDLTLPIKFNTKASSMQFVEMNIKRMSNLRRSSLNEVELYMSYIRIFKEALDRTGYNNYKNFNLWLSHLLD